MSEATAGTETGKVKFASKEYDLDSGIFEVKFGNGERLEISLDELNPDTQRRSALHGIAQKVGDSYAGAKGDYAKAVEAARGVMEQLRRNEWQAARGEGEAKPRIGELAEAIALVKAIDLVRATGAVEKATDEKRKEWRAHPKVKAAIADIRARKAREELEKSEAKELELEE